MAIRFEKVAESREDFVRLAQDFQREGWAVSFIDRHGRMREASEA